MASAIYSKWGTKVGEPQRWFYEHINDETDECIIWPYAKDKQGYGRLDIKKKAYKTSTLACSIKHGERPSSNHVAAHGPCHNYACMNYKHLSWKTYSQNMLDMQRDGTQRDLKGENHYNGKLTNEQIVKIKELYSEGNLSQSAVARLFNIKQTTVWKIVNGVSWTHLLPPPTIKGPDLFA